MPARDRSRIVSERVWESLEGRMSSGAVLVAAGGDDAVELGHQLVIDGDGHALHASLANSGSAPRTDTRHGMAAHGCPSTGWTARGPALRLSSVLVRSRPLANAPSMPAPPCRHATGRRAIRPTCCRHPSLLPPRHPPLSPPPSVPLAAAQK